MSPQDSERMAGAGGQHHPPGAAGGAAAGAGAAVTPAAASAGPGEDSSDSEAEQEGPQKLIRKVSTSGQIRTKVRRARGQRPGREAARRGAERGRPGRRERAGDPGTVGPRRGGGARPGAGPAGAGPRRCRKGFPGGAPGAAGLGSRGVQQAAVEEKGTSGSAGAWEKAAALLRVPARGT